MLATQMSRSKMVMPEQILLVNRNHVDAISALVASNRGYSYSKLSPRVTDKMVYLLVKIVPTTMQE